MQTTFSAHRALWLGIIFSALFTGLIAAAGGVLAGVEKLPDQGASWYYWKLPQPTAWTRASAWVLYAAHQVALWLLIAHAQRSRLRYTGTLHRVNIVALAVNALFIVLHFIQTHSFYDGLAQDVSIWSSQGSVILLLVMVLLLENERRGMFFGRKAPLGAEAGRWARRYHGYIFSWAIIYTFWYHPMEGSFGHLVGFFYMFLLMVQSSLFFTRAHLNRWWTAALEVTVLAHGALVALMQGHDMWPMFAFGFGALLVITQVHGLPLPRWARVGTGLTFIAAALAVYSSRDLARLSEIPRIPVIEYALVFLLAGIISGGLWIWRKVRGTAKPLAAEGRRSTTP